MGSYCLVLGEREGHCLKELKELKELKDLKGLHRLAKRDRCLGQLTHAHWRMSISGGSGE